MLQESKLLIILFFEADRLKMLGYIINSEWVYYDDGTYVQREVYYDSRDFRLF